MDGRFLIQPLTFIGAVINLLILLKIPVAVLRPGRSPSFRIGSVIPVVSWNVDLLPQIFYPFSLSDPGFLIPVFIQCRYPIPGSILPVFRIINRQSRIKHCPAVFILRIRKNGFCFLLPVFILIEPPHRQHDMCMRVSIAFVVQCPVRNHSFRDKVFPDIGTDTFNLLWSRHFHRESDLHFPGQLCVASFLCFLYFVPKSLTVLVNYRRMFRKQDLTHDNPALCRKVMLNSGFVIQQLLSGSICGGGHRRAAGRTADNLYRTVVNCHFRLTILSFSSISEIRLSV